MTTTGTLTTIDDDRNPSERMPVDIRTILLGMWRRRWALLLWALFSAALAVGMALTVAPQIWKAESVLLYQPPSDELLAGMYNPPTIHTQLNMVKVKPNLAETRMRLKLPCTLADLGAACQIKTPRDSQLLVCEVSWDSPEKVADIANTLSEVFIQRQQRLRRIELTAVIREMESRLTLLRGKLNQSGAVKADNRIAFERQLESYRNRINTADEMYEKAITELKAAERKLRDLALMKQELENKLLNSDGLGGQGETMSSLNIRVERLREKIYDTRKSERDALSTIQWDERMRYNERLLSHGFISNEAFTHEKAEYEKHMTLVNDSADVRRLKQELEDIYSRMRPNSIEGIKSTPMVQSLAFEEYKLRLEHGAAVERLAQLEKSRVRLQEQYQQLLRQESPGEEQPAHLVENWRSEARQLREALAKVRAVAESNASDFEYVSRAAKPTLPARSYRKVFCVGLAGFTMTIGFVTVLFLQLVNPTIRSGAEAAIKLQRDDVSVLPKLTEETQSVLDERVRALAERVRSGADTHGACVLVTSTAPQEGRTLLTNQLAQCVARRGETVVVVDAAVRSERGENPGLTNFLRDEDTELTHIVAPGPIPGVFEIERGNREVMPDLLASPRMRELLDQLSEVFDLIIIDGPSGDEHADADVLARFSDGVLMVVKAGSSPSRDVRRVAQRMEVAGAPILSVVLNQTDPLFAPTSL